MSSIPLARIAAIVVAARVQGTPARQPAPDGTPVRALTLHGSHPGEFYDFTLHDGHRRWQLAAVVHDHGTEHVARTLGRRLSSRLSALHGAAAEPATPTPDPRVKEPAMRQLTKDQQLYSQAATHGVRPDQIYRAVTTIAAVQRRDRAAHRERTGQDMTPDQWLAQYGSENFAYLCDTAAQIAGLGERGDLVMRIIADLGPLPEPQADDRPVQFWARPLADPDEATSSPAYRVSFEGPGGESSPGYDWSAALLRATLCASLRRDGAACVEESTGLIRFTERKRPGAYTARPAPGRSRPSCGGCGQWEDEHSLPKQFGSCPQFTPGSAPHSTVAAP